MALSLQAQSIYNGKCVDYFYTLDSSTLKIKYSSKTTESTISESKSKIEELISNSSKFYYEDGECRAILSTNNEIFLSSLVGILIGFTILFFSIFITIKVGAKK